jgi:hypothetical protein
MTTLHDKLTKLAYDNPGEIRDALLPILASQKLAAKWSDGRNLPESSIGIPMDMTEVTRGWMGFLKESLLILRRKTGKPYKMRLDHVPLQPGTFVATISADTARADKGFDDDALTAFLNVEKEKLPFAGPDFKLDMVKNFGRAAEVYISGYTTSARNRRRSRWDGEFPDPNRIWSWVWEG